MSGTASTIAWLLVGLMVVPLAALGADAVQRGLGADPFPTAALHVGERFVYDVTVLSDFHATATTAARHIEIEVGDYESDPRGQVFGVRSERSAAPWDPDTRAPWEAGKKLAQARLHTTAHEYIDADDGRVAYRTDAHGEEHWYVHDGATYRYVSGGQSKSVWSGDDGVALGIARQANARWTHQVPALGIATAETDDPHALPLAGTYRDRPVYGRNVTATETFPAGGADFGCTLDMPPFTYHESDTTTHHEHTAISVATTRVQWRDPDLALPVAVECHRAYIATDGTDIGHIRLVATLVEHDAGGATHHVAWDEEPTTVPDGPLDARATVAPGVPADNTYGAYEAEPLGGDAPALRFPLDHADPLARDHIEAAAADFASAGEAPYALVAARYWPSTEAAGPACAALPDPIAERCVLLPPTAAAAPQAFVEPHWYLTYENAAGERLVVQALRNMTVTGHAAPDADQVSIVGPRHASPHGPILDAVPDELVPVHDMLAAWLDQQGLSLDAWREQELAQFAYHLEPDPTGSDGHAMRPIYTFRQGDVARPEEPDVRSPGMGAEYVNEHTITCRFHAVDGALLEKAEADYRVEDGQLPPASIAPAAFTLPTPDPYQPIAALVVGVVGLGVVAVGATPGGRAWLRGLLALPLFTKLNKEQVLEHRTRDSMLSYVKANPGVGTEEIRRQLDIGWGTAVYHLSALEQNGLLSSMRRGGNRHWFAAGSGRGPDREAIAMLRSPAARRLHDAIRKNPGRTQQELATELGVTHGAIIFQVRKLERVRLIRKERDGRYVRYFGAAPADTREATVS